MIKVTITRKWFDLIASGEKKEEYREIKPYYAARLAKPFGVFDAWHQTHDMALVENAIRSNPDKEVRLCLKNGYAKNAPEQICSCTVTIGQGKPEWGAVPGTEYFIFHIHDHQRDN